MLLGDSFIEIFYFKNTDHNLGKNSKINFNRSWCYHSIFPDLKGCQVLLL